MKNEAVSTAWRNQQNIINYIFNNICMSQYVPLRCIRISLSCSCSTIKVQNVKYIYYVYKLVLGNDEIELD